MNFLASTARKFALTNFVDPSSIHANVRYRHKADIA